MKEIESFRNNLNSVISNTLESLSVSSRVMDALRYVLIETDSKYLRSLLLYQISSKIFNANENIVYDICASLEFLHNYSLIHDDLPSFDNDDYRRNKLSCHKKFGENIAILAGNALLTLAFENLAKVNYSSSIILRIINILTNASGISGMIKGQELDITYANVNKHTLDQIAEIHTFKTGSLFAASCEIGALLGEATLEQKAMFKDYGFGIGYLFQVCDDVIDVDKDLALNRPNVCNFLKEKNDVQNYLDKLTNDVKLCINEIQKTNLPNPNQLKLLYSIIDLIRV